MKIKNRSKEKIGRLIKKEIMGMGSRGVLDFVTNITNRLTGVKPKNPLWVYHPKKGEHHALLKDAETGFVGRARAAGPGTQIILGLRELLSNFKGDISAALASENFISDIDKEAIAHDIRYELAALMDKLEDKNEAIKVADEKFVEVGSKLPDKFNSIPSTLAIAAKLKLEGITGNRRSGTAEPATEEDLVMLNDTLDHLEMQGYGKNRPLRGHPKCVFCGSSAINQKAHMKSKTCINIQNEINKS